jgi:hypothetical protein
MTRQPPRHGYNAVWLGFTLEELKEIDDDPEAAVEAAEEAAKEAAEEATEEEEEGWRVYY